jgi:hypothetical protein
VTIPLPPGGRIAAYATLPAGLTYAYIAGKSSLAFLPEGWIVDITLDADDEGKFTATIEALVEAADPISIRGESVKVPHRTIYRLPRWDELPEGYDGPAAEAPNLHMLMRGESYVSWDKDGNLVAQAIQPEDVEDFQPVLDALTSQQ